MPRRARPTTPWVWLIAVAGGLSTVLSVMAHATPYWGADVAITRAVQAVDFGVLALPLHLLNVLGFPPVVGIAYGGATLALWLAGRRWEAASSVFALLGGAGLNHLVKTLVARPRPTFPFVHVEHHIANGSFPAGHVLNFTAFAGFLGCLAWMNMAPSWRRIAMVIAMIALVLLMGVARIDAGEHWPSDVLGGYLMGVTWLTATLGFYRWGKSRWETRWPRSNPHDNRSRPALAQTPTSTPP